MGCGHGSQRAAAGGNFQQTVVVLRHSERVDQMDPDGYRASEEGHAWPFDSPITANGVQLAKQVATELSALHRTARFGLIVCSPYRRCLETASEVARVLQLPVLLDQEIGEVWEEAMPKESPPHRSPQQLEALTTELGLQILNPKLPEGGFTLFGQHGTWPEKNSDGHKRSIVRLETYIEKSAARQQNFIFVSHVPAVAALYDIFQRGQAEVQRLDYCARVIAKRIVKPSAVREEHGVYADQWEVDGHGVHMDVRFNATEEDHFKFCDEMRERSGKRREQRTNVDDEFELTLKSVPLK